MEDTEQDGSNTARIRKGDLEVEFAGENMLDAAKGATCTFDIALEILEGQSFSTDIEIEGSDQDPEQIADELARELRSRGLR